MPDGERQRAPYRRRFARVLLVDRTERILLLRMVVDAADRTRGHAWFTPGGGVHDGEPLERAAVRERLPADLLRGRVPTEPVRLPWHH